MVGVLVPVFSSDPHFILPRETRRKKVDVASFRSFLLFFVFSHPRHPGNNTANEIYIPRRLWEILDCRGIFIDSFGGEERIGIVDLLSTRRQIERNHYSCFK